MLVGGFNKAGETTDVHAAEVNRMELTGHEPRDDSAPQ